MSYFAPEPIAHIHAVADALRARGYSCDVHVDMGGHSITVDLDWQLVMVAECAGVDPEHDGEWIVAQFPDLDALADFRPRCEPAYVTPATHEPADVAAAVAPVI
jgi:hypothetical protein